MKVLFLNNYRSGTGYGNAGRDLILALDSVNVDVVPRNLDIAGNSCPVPKRILELEKKSDKNPDIIITFSLPHFFCYTNKAKNIGMFSYETNHFKSASWNRKLNYMDEVWVINNQMVDACKNSGVNRPIKVIPHTVDVTKFQRSYKELELPTSDFIFYFIGEVTKRKNLTGLLQAFHTEFNPREPVSLLLKCNVPGVHKDAAYELISKKTEEVKHGIKKFSSINQYKPEFIITDVMTENDMCSLHRRCQCLIAPSYGEAWCLPVLDAMGFANNVITSDNTGFKDFVPEKCRVKCHEVPCYGMVNTFQDLYTSDETWWEPDIRDLQIKMRRIYEDENFRRQQGLQNMNKAFSFGFQQVGLKMKKELERILSK